MCKWNNPYHESNYHEILIAEKEKLKKLLNLIETEFPGYVLIEKEKYINLLAKNKERK